MRTRYRWVAAAACCALSVPLIAGCSTEGSGSAHQGDVVATYGKEQLTSSVVNAWTTLESANPNNSQGVELIAPGYETCSAAAKNTEDDKKKLRDQCAKRHETLRSEVLKSLVDDLKAIAIANKRSATYAQHNIDMFVNVETAKLKSIPGGDDVPDYAVLYRAKAQAARLALDNQAMERDVKDPTERELREFYNKNRGMFATPERRDVQLIIAENKAAANKAHRALQSGTSWAQVFQKYNSGKVITSKNGELPDITRESLPNGKLREAGFSLRPSEYSSVISAPGGYTILRVTSVKRSSPAPKFNRARDQVLAAMQQQKRIEMMSADQKTRESEASELLDCRTESAQRFC